MPRKQTTSSLEYSKEEREEFIRDPMLFRRNEIILPSTGKKWDKSVEPWQEQHVFEPLDRRNRRNGKWVYSLIYLELPRGHAKTLIAASEALRLLVTEDEWYIDVFASDKDQARITAEFIAGFVRRNPRLAASVVVERNKVYCKRTSSRLEVLAADAPSAYGRGGLGQGYMAICDELWTWKNMELWTGIRSGAGKTSEWRILICSNAGNDKSDETGVAWKVRKTAERKTKTHYLYSPRGPVALWWINSGAPDDLKGELPLPTYNRLVMNTWVTAGENIFTEEMVDAIMPKGRLPIQERDNRFHYVGAVDLGLVHDLAARSVGHWDSEQLVVVIDDTRKWQGTRLKPIQIADVEKDIAEVALQYKTRKIVLDPWQMMSTAQRMGKIVEPQWLTSQYRQQISEAFYQQVASGRISLPYDEYLRNQILELVHNESASGYRLEKPQGGHDDLALTIMMIVHWIGANIKGSGRISFSRIGGGPPTARRQAVPGEVGGAGNILQQMQDERRQDAARKELLERRDEEMLEQVAAQGKGR
jgi:hypothetical protein